MDNYVHNSDEWKDTEEEISRYSDIVSLTEYKRTQAAEAIDNVQVGLVPYLVKPGFNTDKLNFIDVRTYSFTYMISRITMFILELLQTSLKV